MYRGRKKPDPIIRLKKSPVDTKPEVKDEPVEQSQPETDFDDDAFSDKKKKKGVK